MPTERPRITITTTKPIYETVTRMAELTGASKSTVINDLLESVHPPLMRTIALLEAANEAPQQVKDGLAGTFEELERQLVGDLGKSLAQLDWLIADTKTKSGSVPK